MDERLSHPKRSWCVTAAFRGGPGGRPGVIQRESQATVIGLQPTSVPSLILPPPLLRRATACSFLTAERRSACVLVLLLRGRMSCAKMMSACTKSSISSWCPTTSRPRFAATSTRHGLVPSANRPAPTRESDPCPASPSGRRTHGAAPPPCERAAAPAPHSHPAAALAQPRRAGAAPPARPSSASAARAPGRPLEVETLQGQTKKVRKSACCWCEAVASVSLST